MAAGHVVPNQRAPLWPPAASELVYTHMRVVKMGALVVPYEQENALALQRSSFRENPTYFLTSFWMRSMTGEVRSHLTDRMKNELGAL